MKLAALIDNFQITFACLFLSVHLYNLSQSSKSEIEVFLRIYLGGCFPRKDLKSASSSQTRNYTFKVLPPFVDTSLFMSLNVEKKGTIAQGENSRFLLRLKFLHEIIHGTFWTLNCHYKVPRAMNLDFWPFDWVLSIENCSNHQNQLRIIW